MQISSRKLAAAGFHHIGTGQKHVMNHVVALAS